MFFIILMDGCRENSMPCLVWPLVNQHRLWNLQRGKITNSHSAGKTWALQRRCRCSWLPLGRCNWYRFPTELKRTSPPRDFMWMWEQKMKALYIFQRSRTEMLGGHDDSVTSPTFFFFSGGFFACLWRR